MNLKEAVSVAMRRVHEQLGPNGPGDLRLEQFLYDDHLAVWSLTIGFAVSGEAAGGRGRMLVRVSEADKSVLSVSYG